MEEFIVWLQENIILVMIAVAVVLILIALVVAIAKASKKNKACAKEMAKAEAEKAATEAFEEKADEVSKETEPVVEDKVEDAEPTKEEESVAEKEEIVETAPEAETEAEPEQVENTETIVKAKSTTTRTVKKGTTFSPRKKSVTVIDPEYVTTKKEEKAKPAPKKTAKKETVKTTEDVAETVETKEVKEDKPARVTGAKWEIHRAGSSYYYLLRASNGEVLATSEAYSTEDGAKSGINTLIKNIDGGEVRIDEDKNENFCFKITSKPPFPRLLCVGQSYKYRKSAEGSFEAVKRLTAQTLPVVSLVGEEDSDHFEEIVVDVKSVAPSNLPGKWEITNRDNGKFGIALKASNGVLVLKGEPRASEDGCLEYIERIKKNLKTGIVKVSEDKNGQFCYKLYTAQKRIVCVGENYSTVQSAISSAESLARFADNANIVNLTVKEEE